MIKHLKGTISAKQGNIAIVDIGGIGIGVFVHQRDTAKMPIDSQILLHTSLYIRENSIELYGFLAEEERDLFELLLQVSGIGPKTAMKLLEELGFDGFTSAIELGDTSQIKKVKGIGKKTAERVILELKDRIKLPQKPTTGESKKRLEVVMALRRFGFDDREINFAIEKVFQRDTSNKKTEELIRDCLSVIGSSK